MSRRGQHITCRSQRWADHNTLVGVLAKFGPVVQAPNVPLAVSRTGRSIAAIEPSARVPDLLRSLAVKKWCCVHAGFADKRVVVGGRQNPARLPTSQRRRAEVADAVDKLVVCGGSLHETQTVVAVRQVRVVLVAVVHDIQVTVRVTDHIDLAGLDLGSVAELVPELVRAATAAPVSDGRKRVCTEYKHLITRVVQLDKPAAGGSLAVFRNERRIWIRW